jgi:hypothetical protein
VSVHFTILGDNAGNSGCILGIDSVTSNHAQRISNEQVLS